MKKIIDKLKRKYKYNKKIINFLLGTVLFGVLFGSILVVIIGENDKLLVKDYIVEFMSNIENKIDYLSLFKNTLFSNLLYIFIIWILGISPLGIPVGVFLCFLKGFVLGFSLSSFILTYKLKGVLLGMVANIPSFLNIIVIVVLSIYALKFSYVLVNVLFKKLTINFKNITKTYSMVLMFSILYVLLTTLIETFLPTLLKTLVFIIK